MKPAASGTVSGCLVWIIAFVVLLTCLVPTAMGVAGVTSTVSGEFVARALQPYLCPDGSTAEIVTHQTTSTDEFGNESPATAYEMQCVDSGGNIVREPSPDYAFIWIGVLGAVGLALSAVLAFVLAAPAGVLIGRLLAGRKKNA